MPGISINEVAGNPFQPDVQFRGFTASPVSGTPQGLAVYQNGVRINEAFGDTVNWDLIPTAAIKSVNLVTNNPAFGLNALGGAVDIQMKDGFNYHGAEIDMMGGSFGRVQSSLQWGKQIDNFAVYGALEGVHDDGFRNFSASNIRRFYGDIGVKNDQSEFHVNMGVADNDFGAAATVPAELLQQFWGATYTTPQTSSNKVGYLNLTGKVEVSPTWTIDGIAHVRVFNQKTQDGNPTDAQPCDADRDAALLRQRQHAGQWPERRATPQSLRPQRHARRERPDHDAIDNDRLLVAGDQYRPVVRPQQPLRGRNQLRLQRHAFQRQRGTRHHRPQLRRQRLRDFPRSIRRSGLGSARSSLRTTNQYTGLYALDTFDVTNRFSVTGGGRFNVANIDLQDQIGTALNGNNTYTRFNPIIGGTYKIKSGLTAYAGYSEANRAPTPLELGCADPAHPASSPRSWFPIRR